MIFETGKYYKHTTGLCMSVLDRLNTTMWGLALIAEQSNGKLLAVDENYTDNWFEISREEWMSNFS